MSKVVCLKVRYMVTSSFSIGRTRYHSALTRFCDRPPRNQTVGTRLVVRRTENSSTNLKNNFQTGQPTIGNLQLRQYFSKTQAMPRSVG